ncbi:MAG: UvrD-helicase domain-containing protein, partial [Bacteroidaceae bacterium]|nr:UvrD-helicase domain-containing protein [Bacteroidaceae bacterium]
KDMKLNTLVETEFLPLLRTIIEKLPDLNIKINSSNAILKHINHLMLLNIINTKVRDLNQEANRFLLADTAHFLNDIIDKNDIPFIYEKIGTRFNHIMIDEFQDTSRLQWENFKPLISNSLDANQDCLLVGDVKQSIYRWRSSDWQILNNMENGDFKSQVKIETLGTNFRSAERVINFNNDFFENASNILNAEYREIHGKDSDDLLHAYSDVKQKTNSKMADKGFVCVKALENTEELTYKNATLEELANTIKEFIHMGINQNDITILVRVNKNIPLICKYFNDLNNSTENIDNGEKINIVSDEAFMLEFSSTINIIITALRVLANKDDLFALACLAYNYQIYVKHNDDLTDSSNVLFLSDTKKLISYLPQSFSKNLEELTFLPLLELTEQLYDILELNKIEHQDAYLFFFHDQMSKYCEDNQSDINSFIQYWDETLHSKTIPNGSANGIRIMSIHKSKGLEFHTVIIPFCDWSTVGNYNNLLWCEPEETPFNDLPLTPINFTKESMDSIFNKDYQNEVLKNDVDNLNLIYVGFTRAVYNLIILTQKNKEKNKKSSKPEDDKIKNISQLIIKSIPKYLEEQEYDDQKIWSIGEIFKSNTQTSKDNINDTIPIKAKFTYYDTILEYRQSNKSAKFINEEDGSTNDSQNLSFIDRGLLYHNVLQQIKTSNDIDVAIDKAIDEVEAMGCFTDKNMKEETRNNIHLAFKNETARSWFNPKWEVRNECTILFKSKKGNTIEKRPDRVISLPSKEETIVIDYKTGDENTTKYNKQVSFYMSLLKKMGYKNIKGFIWYVLEDKIEEVK